MIRELLTNKTAKERADIKAREISKLDHKGRFVRSGVEIEITDLQSIEGGVEVFARAWKNGKQLGFGSDGSVDVERFRIFNPPTLVPDQAGDVVRESVNKTTGERLVVKYREDLKEAVLQVVEHNLSVMKNVYENSLIVAGKIGRTTSTFYPSLDGMITADPASRVTWSTLITGLEGDARTSPDTAGTTMRVFIRKLENDADPWGNLTRCVVLFDTSALGDTDTISSATFSLYAQSKTLVGGGLTPAVTVAIVSSNPASTSALVAADYADELYGTTDFATRLAYASVSTVAYNDFTLNASGIANISKTGISKFGLRVGADVDNSEPTGTGDTYYDIYFYTADQTGTTNDPKLVVEHAIVTVTSRGFFTLVEKA